tara:strand:- start:1095 stop:1799 length:705 start_codon:yes stop_codon:yes gene_type:complete
MPKNFRIFIIRHAESEANLDLKIGQRKPDYAIDLTNNGLNQAYEAGEFLKQYIEKNIFKNNEKPAIRFWSSPYKRTRQTSSQIIKSLGFQKEGGILRDYREKDSLREQDFGDFEGFNKEECAKNFPEENAKYLRAIQFKGQYWSKMPKGESRADVSQRVLSFIDTIMRDIETNEGREEEIRNIIVVTHGVTSRCLIKEYLNLPWEWVQDEPNPNNASIRLIENGEDKGYIFEGF